MRRTVFIFMALIMAVPALAEERLRLDEVVVTASRYEENVNETTSPVEIITAEEIERSGAEFLPDLIQRLSGASVIRNGGPGSNATVQIRGASSNKVVVMIDGVKVKSTTTGEFDFSFLTVDDIERVEIVKGPQSTLYGSDAIGGVVNIITKKGAEETKFTAAYEAGSFGTHHPRASVSGSMGSFNYRLSMEKYWTDGISAYKDGTEKDGYESVGINGHLGVPLGEEGRLELTARKTYDELDLDNFGADDPDYVQKGKFTFLSAKATFTPADDAEYILTASEYLEERKGRDPSDPWGYSNWDFNSDVKTFGLQGNFFGPEGEALTLGVEQMEEEGENEGKFDEKVSNQAAYINAKSFYGPLTVTGGARYDDHEVSGEKTTYRVGVLENREDSGTRYRASYATGFHAPTLNDAFWPYASYPCWFDPLATCEEVGNSELKPEESTSWELAFEKDFGDESTFMLTYFQQDYENLIEWATSYNAIANTYTTSPQNVSEAEVKGVESSLNLSWGENIDVDIVYTYLKTKNKATGKPLIARPKHKGSLGIGYWGGSWGLGAIYTYVGERYDGVALKDVDPYGLLSLKGEFNIGKAFKLYARVENALDEDYEIMGNYGTPGRAYYAGAKAEF